MNLNQIHAGEDYAWLSERGRGENYRRYGFYRIKVIRTFSRREFGNQKETGYAEGFDVEPDTGEFKLDLNGQPRIRQVRARDVVTLWDEYADEHDRQEAERIKKEEEWQRYYEKRKREREEREAKERAEREERERLAREAREAHERERQEKEAKLLSALKEKYGITKVDGFISVSLQSSMVTVYFDRKKLEHELGLNGGDNIARESPIGGGT